MLSAGSCVADERILRLGIQPNGPGEFAVVDPLAQHELILILDTAS